MDSQLQIKERTGPTSTPERTGVLQRKCDCGNHTMAGGECEGCSKQKLQRRPAGLAEPAEVPPIVHEVLSSPGQPLDTATRAFMEPRFGHDFSHVRVHVDEKSEESARAVNALAYTVGRDVVFGKGQYAPETGEGRMLMAHELTHVLQQQSTLKNRTTMLGATEDGYEKEADAVSMFVSDPVSIATKGDLNVPTGLLATSLQRSLRSSVENGDNRLHFQRKRVPPPPEQMEEIADPRLEYQMLPEDVRTKLKDENRYKKLRPRLLCRFKTTKDLIDYYNNNLVRTDFLGHPIIVHKDMKMALVKAAELLKKEGWVEEVSKAIHYVGHLEIRPNANNPTKMSEHSFGQAIDIKAKMNPNVKEGKKKRKKSEKEDKKDKKGGKEETGVFRSLVKGLTTEVRGLSGTKEGIDIFEGKEAKAIRKGGTAEELLPRIRILREASDVYKAAFDNEESLGDALSDYLTNIYGGRGGARIINSILVARVKATYEEKAANRSEFRAFYALTDWLTEEFGISDKKSQQEAANFLLKVYSVFLGSFKKDKSGLPIMTERIEATVEGTLETVAAHGFIDNPPELIAALTGSDGGNLRWLGSVGEGLTKDFMHFELKDLLPYFCENQTKAEEAKPSHKRVK